MMLGVANESCARATRRGAATTLQAFLHPPSHRSERLGQRRGVGAARLGHVGTPATLAAHLRSDEVHQVAGLYPRDQVLRDARDETHLLALGGGEHDGARLELALELVER